MSVPQGGADQVDPSSTSGRRGVLVGRSRELQMLRGQLDEGLTGTGSIVVLGGEAGIGGFDHERAQPSTAAGARGRWPAGESKSNQMKKGEWLPG